MAGNTMRSRLFSKLVDFFPTKPVEKAYSAPRLLEPTNVKLIVVGVPKVGKSSVVRRAVYNCFTRTHVPTIGMDLISNQYADPETTMKVPIQWSFLDIAYPEIKGKHLENYFKDVDGIITVFDCTNTTSIDYVDEWHTVISQLRRDLSEIPTILLCHKSDQLAKDKGFSSRELNNYIKNRGFLFWKYTSAADGPSVAQSMQNLMTVVLSQKLFKKKEEETSYDFYSPRSLSLSSSSSSLRSHMSDTSHMSLSPPHSPISLSSDDEDDKFLDSMSEKSDSVSEVGSLMSLDGFKFNISQEDLKKLKTLKTLVKKFYSELELDFAKLHESVPPQRKKDLMVLDKQRIKEYNGFIKQIREFTEGFDSLELEGNFSLEMFHLTLLENIQKWRHLLENVAIEIKLYSKVPLSVSSDASVYHDADFSCNIRSSKNVFMKDNLRPKELTGEFFETAPVGGPRSMGFGFRNLGRKNTIQNC